MRLSLRRRPPVSPPCATAVPRVSAVVPLYNHARYIAEAIDSLRAQGSVLREIVIVDDGSTDDGAAIVERIAHGEPRIRLQRQANRGAHATINAALALCDGEFLAILNSDDSWAPGRLAALTAALDAAPHADMAWSELRCVDEAGTPIRNDWYDAALATYRDGAPLGVALLNGNFMMSTSNLLIRRPLWQNVGPMAALRYTHDLDWVLRALALGHEPVIVGEKLLRYRIHARNTIAEDHGAVRAEWAATAAAYLSLLWDRPGATPIDWDHAGAAQAVLRTHALDRAVTPCMAYLRREGALSLDRSALLDDAAFRARLRGWV